MSRVLPGDKPSRQAVARWPGAGHLGGRGSRHWRRSAVGPHGATAGRPVGEGRGGLGAVRALRTTRREAPTGATGIGVWVAVGGAAVASSATWLAAVVLLRSQFSQVDELLDGGSLAMLVVAASLVGSVASLLLWQLTGRRARWLLLGGGLFVTACAEAIFGLRQIEGAKAVLVPGVGAVPVAGLRTSVTLLVNWPTMGLLGSAGALVWLALVLSSRHVEGRPFDPLAVLISLVVGAAGACVVSAAAADWFPSRIAGVVLAVASMAGAVWLAAIYRRRRRLPELCFSIALLTLGEAGVSRMVLSAPTLAETVCSAAFRVEAVAWCIVGVVVELERRARTNRATLAEEQRRAQELGVLLAGSELSMKSTRHEVRSALLLLNSAVELLGETEHLGFAALEGDALGFLREAGSRVAAAVGELPRAGEEVDVDRVLDVEVRSAAVRGLSVRLVRLPGSSRGVRGDSTVLSRVVAELLENAARHAPGAAVVVTVGADQSSMLITVTDDGPGIASRDPSAPFTPGWCAPSEVRPQGGMGLAIARWLVESAGGSLAWDPDQAGTVMTITLPLAGPVTSSEARGAGASVADSASASMTTSVSSR